MTASQFGSSSKSKIDPAETLELRTDLADNVYFDYLLDDHIKEPRTAITVYRGERVLVGSTHTLGGSAGNVYEFIGATPLKTQLSNVNYANTVQWREVPNNIAINITSTDTSESLDDSVKIFEVTGNMLLGSITTHGNTWLHSAGGILSATNGGSIQIDPNNFSVSLPALKLTADSGDIGSSAAPINILTTWQTSFSATTPGNIFLHSKKDLAVDQIEAKGNVTLVFDPGFSMIDVDFHDEIDVRGIDEQAKVWENLQLTDTGFDAKRNALISDLEVVNTTQYRTYWALRNQTPNPSNYTSSVRVALSQRDVADLRPSLEREGILAQKTGDELEQYIRDAVKKIEGERTDELHRLHKVVGTLTLAFNPDYKYQATPEEKKQIDDSMHKWTEEELKNLRNSSFVANFLKITDTELVIEQPNIIGASVTIKNAYGVGTYDHGQTIVLKDADGNRPKLNLDQRAAVVAAETGDLIFTTQAPVAVVVSVEDGYKLKLEGTTKNPDAPYGDKSSTWIDLGFKVGQSIMLAGDPGSTTDRGVFYKVISISADGKTLEVDSAMTDGSAASPIKTRQIGSDNFLPKEFGEYLVAPVITIPASFKDATHVHVLRREDVDFHSAGKIEINATNHIFIGSEHEMLLGNILLSNGTGTIQIKANGDLTRSSSDAEILGNVVLLESANGKIGQPAQGETLAQRLRIGKQDETILRAKNDIHAESIDKSPLRVKNVYSSTGVVDLQFSGGFVDLCRSDVAIRANKINLATDNSLGDISGISCPFTIEGTTNEGATINATAKDITLKSKGNLTVGTKFVPRAGGEGETTPEIEGLFASGNLRLESLGSLTILGTMSAGGEMFVAATGQFIAIPESKVLSNGPVTLVLHSLDGSSTPTKLDFLGQLIAPSTIIHGSEGQNDVRFVPAIGSSGEVQLAIENNDSMDYGTNWKAGKPTVKDGQFYHVLSSDTQKLLFKNSVRNTNPISPLDVTADGNIDPIDVLVVINLLNMSSRPAWLLSNGPLSNEDLASFAYYDVNADTRVDPLDVLTIINLLNRREGNAEGEDSAEGEFVASPSLAFTSFTQFAYSSYGHDYFRGSRGNEMLFGRSSKDELRRGRDNALLIGGSTENQYDLTSLDAALADWSGSDWSLALVDLGGAINDDDKDDVRGDMGIDIDSWLTADYLQ